jgi:hypothetical protein
VKGRPVCHKRWCILDAWLAGFVGPRHIAAAPVDEVAGLCGARQRMVPRRVAPGQRGIVTGQPGLVFCWAMYWLVHEASWPGSRK